MWVYAGIETEGGDGGPKQGYFRNVYPTFQCQSAISHHLLHQSGSFLITGVILINKYDCNKTGVKRPSSWSDTPFGPIFLKENHKRGAKKVENQPLPNLLLKTQDDLVL